MDANLIGLLLLLLLLGRGGWDSFDRRRQRNADREADNVRWARLALKIDELKSTLEQDYLRRDTHMREHAALNARMVSLSREVSSQGRELRALKNRRPS